MEKFVVTSKSWHYQVNRKRLKIVNLLWEDEVVSMIRSKRDFCSYWRMTIISIILYYGVPSLIVALGLYLLVTALISSTLQVLLAVLVMMIALPLCFALAFLITVIGDKIKNASQVRRGDANKKGLLETRRRALKEKICPLVDFEG